MSVRAPARSSAERVLVVGGGLVGCVLALYLAQRGLQVTIYERNADCRKDEGRRRPSLSLSLCWRGIRSLERVDVMDRIRPFLAPTVGRMIHARDGTRSYQPYSAFGEAIHCVGRRALAVELLNAAEAQGVAVVFEQRCVGIDAESGTIAIEDATGAVTHDRARAIFAADGCLSAVRRELQRAGWCRFSQTVSAEGYKEFRVPAATAAAADLRSGLLHGWPRQHVIAGAFPEPDGSFAGTLQMPLVGTVSFETLSAPGALTALLDRECPDLTRAVPRLGEQLDAQRPNSLVTVQCRPWSAAGKTLLVGDAAHAMLPYYGQGANAGFEDCAIVGRLIDRHGTDWGSVFHEFETLRKPDTDAMAALCHKHLEVLRHDVSRTDYQAQWILEQRLHRLMPDVFTPLYSMIAFSSTPYAEARRRDRIQQQVVRQLLAEPDIWGQLEDPASAATLRRRVRSRLSGVRAVTTTGPRQDPAPRHSPHGPDPHADSRFLWTRRHL